MPSAQSFDPIGAIIGSWTARATSVPIWLSGLTYPPRYEFWVDDARAEAVREALSYSTIDGQEVRVESVNVKSDTWFVARGTGLARLSSVRWSVCGASADGAVIVVRFDKTRLSAEGVSILVRDGHTRPTLRSEVASDIDAFGLTVEDFASITWFSARNYA